MQRKVSCPPLKRAAQLHVVDAESTREVLDVGVGDFVHVQFISGGYPGGALSNVRFNGDDDCVRPVGGFSAVQRTLDGEMICGASLMIGVIEALSPGTATVNVTSIAEDGEDRSTVPITIRVSEQDP